MAYTKNLHVYLKGLDARINLAFPFPKQALGLGYAYLRGRKELDLKPLPVSAPVFLTHVVRKALSRAKVSLGVLT